MSYGFDFDALDRLDSFSWSHISPIKMKAMAMKMRHKATGHKFTGGGDGKKASKRKITVDETLSQPLMKEEESRAVSFAVSNVDTTRSSVAEEKSRAVSFAVSKVDTTGSMAEEPHMAMGKPDSSASCIQVEGRHNLIGLKGIFLHPFCIPLVCVPLGFASHLLAWGDAWTFWLNFLALVPLAKILGDATEELAAAWGNDTLSGLLNATFGNAVELIVSIQSIRKGLFVVVKASLLGSVLSNILLVLGSSFLLGGFTRSSRKRGKFHSFKGTDAEFKRRLIGLEKEQKFPIKSAMISIGMLLFACCVIVLPTIFNSLPTDDSEAVLKVSRIGSWITVSCYVAYLFFQLLTHSVTLQIEEAMEIRDTLEGGETTRREDAIFGEEEDEEEEEAALDAWVAIALMFACTIVVAANSELIVDSINAVAQGSSLSMGFIGVILLPIAGNACEHASAIRFSMRDRPGLAIGIAVGSSTQVALLVVPASVLIAQALGQPLDLDYGVMNVAVLTFTVLVVAVMLLDGRSNWFKGYILVAMYVFIAALYLYIPHGFGDEKGMP